MESAKCFMVEKIERKFEIFGILRKNFDGWRSGKGRDFTLQKKPMKRSLKKK